MTTDKHTIASWWAEYPMTYAVQHGSTSFRDGERTVVVDLGSKEFFEKADQQFFDWNRPLHNETGPFGRIFPYQKYRGCSVLEIGCGLGCMAMLWAQRRANVTALDLSSLSVEQTKHRFQLFGLKGNIQQGDANNLAFVDESFDYVYSWGVLHHSPNIARSVRELLRTLKRGGQFGVMLYNRHSVVHWYHTLYVEGILHGELRFLDRQQLASRYGDGHRQEGNPHTWPMTKNEVRSIFAPYVTSLKIRFFGTELDYTLRFMLLGLSKFVPTPVKKAWARRWGWSMWISGKK